MLATISEDAHATETAKSLGWMTLVSKIGLPSHVKQAKNWTVKMQIRMSQVMKFLWSPLK
jgi:hypothetical protein